jgi:hypothetical protein
MKNFNGLTEAQLKQLLNGVERLASMLEVKNFSTGNRSDADRQKYLDEAERDAKAYAKARATGGTMPNRDAHLSHEEKTIADETRAWIARQRKRGWWGNK